MNCGTAGDPITLTKDNIVQVIADMSKVLNEQNALDDSAMISVPWLDPQWVTRRLRNAISRTANQRHRERREIRRAVRWWEMVVKQQGG